jgi:hypothetical protein
MATPKRVSQMIRGNSDFSTADKSQVLAVPVIVSLEVQSDSDFSFSPG